jgi:anthranilate synthase component 1
VTTEPSLDSFRTAWDAGRPQVVWRRLIDDLETPVSAYLKIARDRPYAFLFESVEGGAWRGRYSIVAMKPDLVWRCRGDQAEVAEPRGDRRRAFTPQSGGALDSLRDLVAARASNCRPACRRPPPASMAPSATTWSGWWSLLPNINPDPLDLPDAVMIRPSIVAVFDAIAQEIVLVTPARPVKGVSAEDAHADGRPARRGDGRPSPAPARPRRPEGKPGPDIFDTPVSRGLCGGWSRRPRTTSAPATSSRSCPASASARPSASALRPLSLAAADQPLALPVLSELRRLPAGRLQPRDPRAAARRQGDHPADRRHPPARRDAGRGRGAGAELLADPKERAEHLMLLDLGRNDVGRVARLPAAAMNRSQRGGDGASSSSATAM